MSKSTEGKIGSIRELFFPRDDHEGSEFSPGNTVIFLALKNEVCLINALSTPGALKRKSFTKITYYEFKKMVYETIP